MNITRFFEWIERRRRAIQLSAALVLVLLVGLVFVFVYKTGGIKFVYSHSMYIPILLAGLIFGIKGGVFIGLLGGMALGPFMPINVATEEMQGAVNWAYRTGFFTLIGFLSGAASYGARRYWTHLRWISQHDVFTRLPNRNALYDKLSELYDKKGECSFDAFVLAVVSFENALELKSAFGIAVIEEGILQMARRFENKPQTEKYIFRTDTAQIGVLINIGSQEKETRLEELSRAALEPVWYNGIPIHFDIRMGTVTCGEVEGTPELYLQKAEAALVVAQENAQDSVNYNPEIMIVTEENLAILGELKNAINEGQVSLHYQPKIHIPTGEVHGAEALMRWRHPVRGNIPPGMFIPRAEHSTLIQLITEFAIEKAVSQIVQWEQHDIHVPVSVNISARNLLQPGFADMVSRTLQKYGLSGEWLELEVTERALMMDIKHTIDELNRMAELGILFSIDDFGTGYSSLQYLHQLPISL
ncbi:MAG: EAL domain-containing protein, partial [Desulfobacterales bacterium]